MAGEACPSKGRGPAIHDFAEHSKDQSWMPTFVGMTVT
jgi:hypothetical protein